jgi:hypothetical protein
LYDLLEVASDHVAARETLIEPGRHALANDDRRLRVAAERRRHLHPLDDRIRTEAIEQLAIGRVELEPVCDLATEARHLDRAEAGVVDGARVEILKTQTHRARKLPVEQLLVGQFELVQCDPVRVPPKLGDEPSEVAVAASHADPSPPLGTPDKEPGRRAELGLEALGRHVNARQVGRGEEALHPIDFDHLRFREAALDVARPEQRIGRTAEAGDHRASTSIDVRQGADECGRWL